MLVAPARPISHRMPTARALSPHLVAVPVAGGSLLAYLLWRLPPITGSPLALAGELIFFLLLTLVAANRPVALPRGGAITVAFAVDFACLLIYGPALAGLVGVASVAFLLRRSPRYRVLYNAGQVALSVGVAGLAYSAAGGRFVWFVAGPIAFHRSIPALGLAGLVYVTVNTLMVTLAVARSERRSLAEVWASSFRWMAMEFLALGPFGVLIALVYQVPDGRALAVGLFVFPLFLARYAFQGGLEVLAAHQQTVGALCDVLETYDAYTRSHSEAVARYAEEIAQWLRLPRARREALAFAARLHDVGKCHAAWDEIIRKRGPLADWEWQVIRQHPVEGAAIASQIEFLPGSAAIVRAHHEHLDGTGYPDGLAGDQIDLAARILAVADALEAMTQERPYRPMRSLADAVQELDRCAGTQFDARVVAAVRSLAAEGRLLGATA